MNNPQDEYISYQLEKCKEAYAAAILLLENDSLNAAVNRLYYSCFYAVNALTVKNGLKSKSHSGLKNLFYLHFIKTGTISPELGKFYSVVFENRQKGDYGDFFDVDRDTIEKLLPQARIFIDTIESMII